MLEKVAGVARGEMTTITYVYKRRRNIYVKPQNIGSFEIFWCWEWELDFGSPELKYFIELSKPIEDYILALDIK